MNLSIGKFSACRSAGFQLVDRLGGRLLIS
jgi:hypothetical protein